MKLILVIFIKFFKSIIFLKYDVSYSCISKKIFRSLNISHLSQFYLSNWGIIDKKNWNYNWPKKLLKEKDFLKKINTCNSVTKPFFNIMCEWPVSIEFLNQFFFIILC